MKVINSAKTSTKKGGGKALTLEQAEALFMKLVSSQIFKIKIPMGLDISEIDRVTKTIIVNEVRLMDPRIIQRPITT